MKTRSLQTSIMENYTQYVAAAVETKRPLFEGILNPQANEHQVRILAAMGKNMPLIPLQAKKIGALTASMEKYGRVIYSGDTGIGKTITGVALSFERAVKKLGKNPKASFNTYVVSPPHLVKKWANEARKVLKGVIDINIVIVKSYKDIISLTKKADCISGYNFFVVSKNKNSGSYRSKQVFNTKYRRHDEKIEANDSEGVKRTFTTTEYRWHYTCVDCGSDISAPTIAKDDSGYKTDAQVTLPRKAISKCRKCSSSIMQPTNKTISPAEYLSRYGKTGAIDLLIVDEIHEEKAKDTQRSKAFGQLLAKSKFVVGLTGTFLGGYASHAFYTLFRMFPSLFIKDLYLGWEDCNKFIEEFGGSEKHFAVDDMDLDTLEVTKKGRSYGAKERADLSPRLLDVLLPMIVFARLDEIKFMEGSASLPKYTELTHLVEHDEVFQIPQHEYLRDVTEASSYELRTHNERKGFGHLKTNALLIPDLPFRDIGITLPIEDGEKDFKYVAPVTREEYPITNKEQKLVDIVKENLSQDRKVLVYHDFVNSGLRAELMEILEKYTSAKVDELTSSTSADKREEYIDNMDCDVLITNPELVKTGLDLLEYPTIIFYEQAYSSYNVFTMRQAAKRAWRIGQEQDCEVHCIAYAGTNQQHALSLMGAKMNISQGVEGKLSTGADIASEAEEENLQIAMARALLNDEKIANDASSTSTTLDLNDRDWDAYELYYLEHLEAYKLDPTEYLKLIPNLSVKSTPTVATLAIEEPEVIEMIEEEVSTEPEVVEVIEEIVVEDIAPKSDSLKDEKVKEGVLRASMSKVMIMTEVKIGRRRVKQSVEVTVEEMAKAVEEQGSIQLTLF